LQASPLFDVEKILIAALITAALAYLNQLWKYSRDAYQARVDEACKLIFDTADMAGEYWTQPKLAESIELISAEAKIAGRVAQLQFLRLLLELRNSSADRHLLRERAATFQDALTGGTFRNAVRPEDLARSNAVFQTAADLVDHIRRAADRGNKWWRIAFQHLEVWLPYRRPNRRRARREEVVFLAAFTFLFVIGLALCLIQIWLWL
jgi:hypothetical protein